MDRRTLLIVGASARAAAFSALRAGFAPCCADLFADVDLRHRCPVTRMATPSPECFADWLKDQGEGEGESAVPWMYTGGLENHPILVERMARRGRLLGNDRATLEKARSPAFVHQLLSVAGLPRPELWCHERPPPHSRRWLCKPLASAIGHGVGFLDESVSPRDYQKCYLQEYIEGESRAALYLGAEGSADFLGVTRQLVGLDWLHAAPFQYCGSIGPLELSTSETESFTQLGNILTSGCGLRGLFGVDGIWREGVFFPVEINPRYTASVEVLEYATGWHALQSHASAFGVGEHALVPSSFACIGKAILYARTRLTFPEAGPWSECLRQPLRVTELTPFADLPLVGEVIEPGHPVLTFFTQAASVEECEKRLQVTARDLDGILFPQPIPE